MDLIVLSVKQHRKSLVGCLIVGSQSGTAVAPHLVMNELCVLSSDCLIYKMGEGFYQSWSKD